MSWVRLTAAGVLAAGTAGASGGAFAAEKWPDRVVARYDISFAGFDIGHFEFASQVEGRTYSLRSSAKLSALLGAFR